jgi:protein-disulfide isomerase/uncharacterized membrane protein
MPPSPARHRVALVVALAGAALSTLTWVVHSRIESDAGYTSFCNLGGVVSCDAVLASRYATVLGIPVAVWGLAAFLVGALLALPGALGRRSPSVADLLLLALVSASAGVALVLLVIAGSVLRHACPLCLALDVVILVWLVAVLPLARRFDATTPASWWRGRGPARAAVAGSLVLAIAGATWAAVSGPGPATSPDDVRARDPKFFSWYTRLPVRPASELVSSSSHVKGAPQAAVSIVEFSDFQCPFCVQAWRDLGDLVRSRPDVSLAFRHFPLDTSCNPHLQHSVHPDACLAACAAECAAQQGRFWEYHDILFANHEHLERDNLFRFARELGLDIPRFRTCLDDPATKDRVVADVDAGARAGVSSTPTLFINGRAVEGALDRRYYDYALILEQHALPPRPRDDAS